MSKIKKALSSIAAAFAIALVATAPAFAATNCATEFEVSSSKSGDYRVQCAELSPEAKTALGISGAVYAKSSAACHKLETAAVSPDFCNEKDLNSMITTVINVIVFVIGLLAVFMIILGGIYYTTSSGDPGKTKKAKDTILYGIVGLVVSLLAFSLVNFVLGKLF